MNCDRHAEIVKDIEKLDDRVDKLEKQNIGFTKDIQSLCEKLDNLTSSIKWLIITVAGSFITGTVGIFFVLVKKGLGV